MEIIKQRFLIITIFLAFLFICRFSTKVVATKTDIEQQFISILYFKEEEYFPADVGYYINNTYLYGNDIDRGNNTYPTDKELSKYTNMMKKILE